MGAEGRQVRSHEEGGAGGEEDRARAGANGGAQPLCHMRPPKDHGRCLYIILIYLYYKKTKVLINTFHPRLEKIVVIQTRQHSTYTVCVQYVLKCGNYKSKSQTFVKLNKNI